MSGEFDGLVRQVAQEVGEDAIKNGDQVDFLLANGYSSTELEQRRMKRRTWVEELPQTHIEVLDICHSEARANYDQRDALSLVDVATDIAQRLHRVYGVVAVDEEGRP